MTAHLTVLPGGRDDTWQDRGACRGSSQDHWFPTLRGELTDGQADALLIAEYARRVHSGRAVA